MLFRSVEMEQIADWMKQVADHCVKAATEEKLSDYATELQVLRAAVRTLALKFPVPGTK